MKRIFHLRNNIKFFTVVALVAALTTGATAGEKPTVSGDLTFATKYVWRGLILTDDPVLQPSATLSHKGFSLNIWANDDLTDKGASGASEITEFDYTLDYSFNVKKFSFGLGVIQYTFPNTGSEGTTEILGTVGYDFFLSPSLTLYWDTDEAGGVYGNLSLSHSFGLGKILGIIPSLDFSAGTGFASSNWNEFYYSVDSGGFVDLLLTIGLSIPVDDYLSLSPFISYSTLLDSDLEDAQRAVGVNDKATFYGATITVSF